MALFPLSYAQRSLWLLHQFAPEGGAYNVNIPLHIRSIIDTNRLRICLDRLLQRHEMLRARYIFDGKELGYEISPNPLWQIQEITVAPTTSNEALWEVVSRHSHEVFPLDQWPVFRVFLFSRGPQDKIFLFSTHHINGDLFSIAQLMEELFALYASPDPEHHPLPPVEATFAEHVQEQKEFLEGPEGQRQWAYWSSQLMGPLPKIHFPLDHPRPAIQGHQGAMILSRIPQELNLGLREITGVERTTLFSTLLAIFYASLYAITGQSDLIVGTPVPGRRGKNRFERVMGTFVNVLPLRARLEPGVSFRDLLQQVTRLVKQGREHQDFPFPLLVERLRIPRDTSRTPVFQTYFTLQRLPHRPELLLFFLPMETPFTMSVGDLTVGTVPLPQQEGQLEVAVHVYDVNHELFVEYKYNKDLFEKRTVERMMESYLDIARQVVESMDWPLSRLLAPRWESCSSEAAH
ncbi:MAG: condensation domain-containing protein [Myxococcales bacterium]|nr:condensation domain-containing protein [Polyangiaceae bacterium]MDW8250205.1 condensation domain-containing protein [Myxococcales bacterium]